MLSTDWNMSKNKKNNRATTRQTAGNMDTDEMLKKILDAVEKEMDDTEEVDPVSPLAQKQTIDFPLLVKEIRQLKESMSKDMQLIREDLKAINVKLIAHENEIQKSNEKMKLLEKENVGLKQDIADLSEQLISTQLYSMKDNLIIDGIKQKQGEVCIDEVKKFFREQLKIAGDNFTILKCHRLPGRKVSNRPPPIICRFLYPRERESVWEAKKELKGTSYFLREHFPSIVNQRRSKLLPIMKEAKAQNMKARLQVDKLLIESILYTVDTLDQLPANLNPAEIGTKRTDKVTAFFTAKCPLSNFFSTPDLQIDNESYSTVEQYFQAQKAYFAEKPETAQKIKTHASPAKCKQLGDRIEVDDQQWLPIARNAMLKACRAKFHSNPVAKEFLLKTGNTLLVEASPNLTWGSGIHLESKDATNTDAFKGRNELGKILTTVRTELQEIKN